MPKPKKVDYWWAPIMEGALILSAGVVGLALRAPLIFSSLGPTIYEQIETPERPSARVYNILVGHLLAMGAGFLSLFILGAWSAPKVVLSSDVVWPRIGASVLAVAITALGTLLLKATQPAALSTTLLVSTGSFQDGWKAMAIVLGVVVVTLLGQPLRRIRLSKLQGQASGG